MRERQVQSRGEGEGPAGAAAGGVRAVRRAAGNARRHQRRSAQQARGRGRTTLCDIRRAQQVAAAPAPFRAPSTPCARPRPAKVTTSAALRRGCAEILESIMAEAEASLYRTQSLMSRMTYASGGQGAPEEAEAIATIKWVSAGKNAASDSQMEHLSYPRKARGIAYPCHKPLQGIHQRSERQDLSTGPRGRWPAEADSHEAL